MVIPSLHYPERHAFQVNFQQTVANYASNLALSGLLRAGCHTSPHLDFFGTTIASIKSELNGLVSGCSLDSVRVILVVPLEGHASASGKLCFCLCINLIFIDLTITAFHFNFCCWRFWIRFLLKFVTLLLSFLVSSVSVAICTLLNYKYCGWLDFSLLLSLN